MRDFATFLLRFWTSGPGKKFRGDMETQLVCAYLFTAPGSNYIGIYYLPVGTIAHDIGIPFEGASKGLRRAIEGKFCSYDEASEHVFVREMAQIQVLERADKLNPKDKKIIGVKKELLKYRESIHFVDFVNRYRDAFHLVEPEYSVNDKAPCKPLASPLQAPSEGHPLRDRDKRQETETREGESACARAREADTETIKPNLARTRDTQSPTQSEVQFEKPITPEVDQSLVEVDWGHCRDIFSMVRERYGLGPYHRAGYGKHVENLSNVASTMNKAAGTWTAAQLVELSAVGFVVSANEATKAAKYNPAFWWGDSGSYVSAGLEELKRWELAVTEEKISAIRKSNRRDESSIKEIEALIAERERISESTSQAI